MPRESVFGTDPEGTKVQVGWERDRHVQVGIGGPVEFQFTGTCPDGSSVSGPYDSLWVTLDRHGINTLIRHLRRAREAAFGRDE